MKKKTLALSLFFILSLIFTACGNSSISEDKNTSTPAVENTPVQTSPSNPAIPNDDTAYPAPGNDSSAGYPQPQNITNQSAQAYPDTTQALSGENVSSEPPDPERNLPAPAPGAGTLGGVLVREVTDGAFTPVTPLNLYLADILEDSKGRQALLSWSEESHKADLLPTGIFIFNNVTPSTYGLVIDLGFAQFPLTNQDGSELFVTIEAGQALDLGQIFVTLPNQDQ